MKPIKHAAANTACAFAPASVGNISVGFDLLGHAIDGPRDIARVTRRDKPGVTIRSIQGQSIRGSIAGVETLPLDTQSNTAGRGVAALCNGLNLQHGFSIQLEKGIPLGSGLGGSAASAVAALVAANALLDEPIPRDKLYAFALDGESASSDARHGDNVASQLLGGVVMATSDAMVPLTVPDNLYCVVVHPALVVNTRAARAVLSAPYSLAQAVAQTTNLALFLTGLQRGDTTLIRAGLHDALVEPRRADLIPGFYAVKNAAMDAGAIGAGISGAGPSVFAWFDAKTKAEQAGAVMQAAFAKAGLQSVVYLSPVAGPRAELIESVTNTTANKVSA